MSHSPRSRDPDLKIYRKVDFASLRQPELDTVLSEDAWWLPYRGYWPTWGATFEDAQRCLRWERELLERLSDRTKEAEDALLDEALDELDANEEPNPSWGFDLGMGAAVLALSSAGCATLVSCSGHFGEGRWIAFPMVQFAADEARASILLEAAESADCGMADSVQGLVEVWASRVEEILDFAEAVIARQARFAALPPAIRPRTTDEESGKDLMHQIHPDQGTLFDEA